MFFLFRLPRSLMIVFASTGIIFSNAALADRCTPYQGSFERSTFFERQNINLTDFTIHYAKLLYLKDFSKKNNYSEVYNEATVACQNSPTDNAIHKVQVLAEICQSIESYKHLFDNTDRILHDYAQKLKVLTRQTPGADDPINAEDTKTEDHDQDDFPVTAEDLAYEFSISLEYAKRSASQLLTDVVEKVDHSDDLFDQLSHIAATLPFQATAFREVNEEMNFVPSHMLDFERVIQDYKNAIARIHLDSRRASIQAEAIAEARAIQSNKDRIIDQLWAMAKNKNLATTRLSDLTSIASVVRREGYIRRSHAVKLKVGHPLEFNNELALTFENMWMEEHKSKSMKDLELELDDKLRQHSSGGFARGSLAAQSK
jgi:hypothetical protein